MLDFSTIKSLKIGGIDLVKLTINGVLAWKKGFKNWVKYSIDTDGSIFNGGLGYQNHYRLSSSGVTKEQDNSVVTGFIPVKSNDLIRVSPYPWYSTAAAMNYICVYDSNFNFLYAGNSRSGYQTTTICSSITQNGDVTEIQLKAISNMAYMRLNYYGTNDGVKATDGKLIITVNEEIE